MVYTLGYGCDLHVSAWTFHQVSAILGGRALPAYPSFTEAENCVQSGGPLALLRGQHPHTWSLYGSLGCGCSQLQPQHPRAHPNGG